MSGKVFKLTKTAKRRPKSDSGGNKLEKEYQEKEPPEQHYDQSNKTGMHTFGEVNAAVPAFLAKLWRLVDDPETNNLICWSKDGRSFIIQNQAQFARDLLPLNYKHNNMASFIRQLNMYGFHKITSIDNGGLKFDRDEMEFSHPCFKRNCIYLLEHIKRKISNTKNVDDKSSVKTEAVSKVLQDVKAMRGRQDSLDSRFSVMKQENEALWREIASLRQKHAKQQQIVNKLIQFLITIVQPSRNMSGVKRHMQLMIHDTPDNSKLRKTSESESEAGSGPVIHELGEELLDEVADTVSSLINPNSPYDKLAGHYDNDCTSPQTLERPQSAISVGSQNYDNSNQGGEDPFNMAANVTQAGGLQTSTGIHTVLPQSNSSPTVQQVIYHVSEVPDAHPTEIPQSPYNDDNNVLTTPLVREQEARLLKEKNKQRQKISTLTHSIGNDTIAAPTAPKLLRSSRQMVKQQELISKPIQVKTEPDMDPMMFLNPYSDNTFMNVDSNLISPNSQLSGEESRQSAGQLNVDLATMVNTANSDLYNANFISNDMPSELFEDTPLLNENTSEAYKLNQQQQFGRNTASNGKISSTITPTSVDADNKLDNADAASTSAAAAAPVTNVGLPSTSKGAGKSLPQPQEQQLQRQGKNINNLTVAKYNGSGGVVPGGNEDHLRHEVHDHLDNLQDELETLKDLLRGDNYSIDQNMLIGLIGSRRLDAKPGAASFNNTILDYPNFGKQMPVSDADETELMNKLFNDADLLDTYGLSFHNDNMNDKNKGSELMTYQPMYDLSDMMNDNKNANSGGNVQDGPSSSQLNSPNSVLNTPYHE